MPGQAGQRPVQRLDPRGVIEPAGHVLGEVRDLAGDGQPRERGPVPPSRPALAAGHVGRDPEQPGPERAAVWRDPVPAPPGLKERHRHHLLGRRPVAGQPEGVVVHRLGARVEDRTERVSIPGPGASPQLRRWIVHIRQLAGPPPGFP